MGDTLIAKVGGAKDDDVIDWTSHEVIEHTLRPMRFDLRLQSQALTRISAT